MGKGRGDEEPDAEAEAEAEPEPLTPAEQAAKLPDSPQMVNVKFNGQEKIFNANCWAVNLLDALRAVAEEAPESALDLADAETGQLQGANIRGAQTFANTFIKTRATYVLVRIESAPPAQTAIELYQTDRSCASTEAVDEEGNETEELKYVPLLPGEKVLDEEGNPVVDEEGNETGEEKPAEFEVLAPEPIPEEVRKKALRRGSGFVCLLLSLCLCLQ